MQKEYTRNTISSPRSIITLNYAIVLCIFLVFKCGPKLFSIMEHATFERLLLNLNCQNMIAVSTDNMAFIYMSIKS